VSTMASHRGTSHSVPLHSLPRTIMKLLNLFAIVSLLGCANNAVLASTCSEESGICVCLGECPSFTNDWAISGTDNTINRSLADAEPPCVSCKSPCDSSAVNGVTVNGQSYPNPDPCPNDNSAAGVQSAATASLAGMFGAHYASVLLTAAAVMGGVAAL